MGGNGVGGSPVRPGRFLLSASGGGHGGHSGHGGNNARLVSPGGMAFSIDTFKPPAVSIATRVDGVGGEEQTADEIAASLGKLSLQNSGILSLLSNRDGGDYGGMGGGAGQGGEEGVGGGDFFDGASSLADSQHPQDPHSHASMTGSPGVRGSAEGGGRVGAVEPIGGVRSPPPRRARLGPGTVGS